MNRLKSGISGVGNHEKTMGEDKANLCSAVQSKPAPVASTLYICQMGLEVQNKSLYPIRIFVTIHP